MGTDGYSSEYPNLGMLERRVRAALCRDPEYCRIRDALPENVRRTGMRFRAEVFPQMWGSTCGGLDVCANGAPAVGGSAMTEEYTTVFTEEVTGYAAVCFGNTPAYGTGDTGGKFAEDLKNRSMAPLSEAGKRY